MIWLNKQNMKVILYMAITINGFIAKENDDTSFVSEIEWNSFRKMIKNVGNMIIGSRTYKIMKDGGEFENLENVRVLVVSNDTDFKTIADNHSIVKSPQDALAILEKKGFDNALVAGGGMLNASFMTRNLIDEIYLDIEPVAFGKGIRLFEESNFESRLKLLEIKKLSDNEIQLHYQVLK